MVSVLEKFKETLHRQCHLNDRHRIVVGVSGGPDSLTLLHLLCQTALPVVAVYFNHQLRPESEREADYVQKLAEQWGAESFLTGKEDVRRLAVESGCSLETAARKARYRFLLSVAENQRAQAVAVGHTADDQVETVLMHLLRGSGLEGLRGMEYRTLLGEFSTTIPVVRPLLGFWRAEIEQYCLNNGIHPLQDVSNLSTEFTRNRIRLELIPLLQQYNPQIKRRLWTMSRVVSRHLQVIEPVVEQTMERVCLEKREGECVIFNAAELRNLTQEMLNLVLWKALKTIKPVSENIDWQHVNHAVDEILGGRTDGIIQLGDEVELLFSQNILYLKTEKSVVYNTRFPFLSTDAVITIPGEGRYGIGNGWTLSVALTLPASIPPRWKDNPFEAWLDADKVQFPLTLRVWKKGERFRPLGMKEGSIKIADFLSGKKIPAQLRRQFPLLYSGNQVVWLPGLQITDDFRLSEQTKRVLHLSLWRN